MRRLGTDTVIPDRLKYMPIRPAGTADAAGEYYNPCGDFICIQVVVAKRPYALYYFLVRL